MVFGGTNSGAGDGGSAGASPAPTASAPSEQEIAEGADKSSVEHGGHSDDDAATGAEVTAAAPAAGSAAGAPEANVSEPDSATGPAPAGESLAETGGDGSTRYLAMGGAAALAMGAAALFASVRRRADGPARRGHRAAS